MRFFAYSPSVEAYIQTEDGKVIDVSVDIVRGNVSRRVNAASTFSLTLSNKKFKYNNVIQPMNKIVIFMTKTKRIQVFAGYVDSAPLYQVYPGDVTVSGTCTIKRLENFYWDEGLWASSEEAAMGMGDDDMRDGDAGIWKAAVRVLTNVTSWPENAIHVAELPKAFVEWAMGLYDTQMQDEVDRLMIEKWVALLGTGQAGAVGSPGGVPGSIPEEYKAKIQELSALHGIPAAFICAVAKAESNWDAEATNANRNGSGDYGLMQINTIHRGKYPDYFPPSKGYMDGNRSLEIGAKELAGHFEFSKSPSITPSGNMDDILLNTYRCYNGGQGGWKLPVTLVNANKVMGFYREYASQTLSDSTVTGSDGQVAAQTSVPVSGTAEPHADFPPKSAQTQASGSTGSRVPPCGLYRAPKTPAISGLPGSKGPGLQGLQQALSDTIEIMFRDAAAAGHKVSGNGGWRTYERQKEMVAEGNTLAATPGRSNHGWGLALDLSFGGNAARQWVHANCGRYGLRFPMNHEPWHIEPSIEKVAGLGGVEYDGRMVAGAGSAGEFGDLGGSGASPLAQAYWLIHDLPKLNPESLFLTGRKSLMNDSPVWPTIKNLFNASMRSVMSAPDGSLVAWYPDKFGVYSRTPYFIIEDIELIHLEITRSDKSFTSHVFTTGVVQAGGNPNDTLAKLNTKGVVSIDSEVSSITRRPLDDGSAFEDEELERHKLKIPQSREVAGSPGVTGDMVTELLKGVINIPNDEQNKYSPNYLFSRYGARPLPVDAQSLININGPMPFLLSLWTFIEKWSQQYTTEARFTFMPELFPGGRVSFANHDLEMYVEGVTHSFDYQNSGFETRATLSCPVSDSRGGFVRSGGLVVDDENDSWIDEYAPSSGGSGGRIIK